jgi:sulfite reductase alpha subunit-like flavoprotein
VAVSVRRTPYGRKRVGLCSGYLAQLRVGDTLRIAVQRGAIHRTAIAAAGLPVRPPNTTAGVLPPPPLSLPSAIPLILIGPGTGVAPMRALIAQYCAGSTAGNASARGGSDIPRVLLFFGCRKAQRDNLYGAEWAALNVDANPYMAESGGGRIDEGTVRVVIAFSQDQDVKDYVTHRILAHGATVCAMLQAVSLYLRVLLSSELPIRETSRFGRALLYSWRDPRRRCQRTSARLSAPCCSSTGTWWRPRRNTS